MALDDRVRTAGTQAGEAHAHGTAASSAEDSRPTYGDLLAHFQAGEAVLLEEQQSKNRVSALTQFLKFMGLDYSSLVDQEFGDDFDKTLSSWLTDSKQEGKQPGTLANRKTWLRQWKLTWQSLVDQKSAPKFDGFGDAFVYYRDKAVAAGYGLPFQTLSLKLGLRKNYLHEVATNRVGSPNISLEVCGQLEELLQVAPYTLSRFIQAPEGSLSERTFAKLKATTFGQMTADLAKQTYALPALTSALRAEVKEVLVFKTAISVAPLKRNQTWRLQPKSKFSAKPSDFDDCSPDGKKFSASCNTFNSHLRRFFGFLKGEGYDEAKFSLAYFTDYSLIAKYLEFVRSRHGHVTETASQFIATARSMLYSKGGYLRQQPKFASRLYQPVPEAQWEQWCAAQEAMLKTLDEDLKKGRHVKKGRDVYEPIKDILEREHPITALFEMAENMERHLESATYVARENELNKATLKRDLLIIKLLVVQPLRIKMFNDMQYLPDNTGNLYQRSNGDWAIRFKPEDFKNEKGAAQKPYDVPLPKDLSPAIEEYLRDVRPVLRPAGPQVFVSGAGPRAVEGRNTRVLAVAMLHRTRQFIPGCPGFGPHAVRHIVATDYIKNNPNGFQIAADVLHDKLETVLRHYAHLKAADGHRHYQQYLQGVRGNWRKRA